MSTEYSNYEKIRFALTKDEHGYPPVESELIWGRPDGNGRYSIKSIPFFANLLAIGDVVLTKYNEHKELQYAKHESHSGHSTIRAIFRKKYKDYISSIREILNILGCQSELANVGPLLAIDIPSTVRLEVVRNLLSDDERNGLLSIEEACIWDWVAITVTCT